MNRVEFQRLAEVRLREAEALLAAGLWDGAYYLAGYAVECGLKACIARRTVAEAFPPKPEVVRDYYSHDLAKLMAVAGLAPTFDAACAADAQLRANWRLVRAWSEQSRYTFTAEPAARTLVQAVADPTAGVLPWVTTHW